MLLLTNPVYVAAVAENAADYVGVVVWLVVVVVAVIAAAAIAKSLLSHKVLF